MKEELETRVIEDIELHWIKRDTGCWKGPSQEFAGLASLCLKHVRKRDLVLCAGGALGMYPRLWARDFAHVVTAEPCPVSFSVLEMNCVGDKYRRINAALGDVAGTVMLRRMTPTNVGMHRIVEPGETHANLIEVPMVRVDDLGLDALDLLSLDVEGSEGRVLRGALESINKFEPVISLECPRPETKDLMQQLGYVVVGVNASDTVFAKTSS